MWYSRQLVNPTLVLFTPLTMSRATLHCNRNVGFIYVLSTVPKSKSSNDEYLTPKFGMIAKHVRKRFSDFFRFASVQYVGYIDTYLHGISIIEVWTNMNTKLHFCFNRDTYSNYWVSNLCKSSAFEVHLTCQAAVICPHNSYRLSALSQRYEYLRWITTVLS